MIGLGLGLGIGSMRVSGAGGGGGGDTLLLYVGDEASGPPAAADQKIALATADIGSQGFVVVSADLDYGEPTVALHRAMTLSVTSATVAFDHEEFVEYFARLRCCQYRSGALVFASAYGAEFSGTGSVSQSFNLSGATWASGDVFVIEFQVRDPNETSSSPMSTSGFIATLITTALPILAALFVSGILQSAGVLTASTILGG